MKRLDDILKNTLISLYADMPEVVDCLKLLDYQKVNYKFKHELFSRISPEEFEEMDSILRSNEYLKYKMAIDEAAGACTRELSELIESVITDKEGDVN